MNGTSRMSFVRLLGWLLGITAFILLLAAILVPWRHVNRARPITCLYNLKQLGSVLAMYEGDWDDRLPVLHTTSDNAPNGQGWTSALWPYTKNTVIFGCPSEPSNDQPRIDHHLNTSYAFNRRLSGVQKSGIVKPEEVAILWDTVGTRSPSNNISGCTVWSWGDPGSPKPGDFVVWPDNADVQCRNWPSLAQPRHHDDNNVCYADGHAQPCKPGTVPRMSPK